MWTADVEVTKGPGDFRYGHSALAPTPTIAPTSSLKMNPQLEAVYAHHAKLPNGGMAQPTMRNVVLRSHEKVLSSLPAPMMSAQLRSGPTPQPSYMAPSSDDVVFLPATNFRANGTSFEVPPPHYIREVLPTSQQVYKGVSAMLVPQSSPSSGTYIGETVYPTRDSTCGDTSSLSSVPMNAQVFDVASNSKAKGKAKSGKKAETSTSNADEDNEVNHLQREEASSAQIDSIVKSHAELGQKLEKLETLLVSVLPVHKPADLLKLGEPVTTSDSAIATVDNTATTSTPASAPAPTPAKKDAKKNKKKTNEVIEVTEKSSTLETTENSKKVWSKVAKKAQDEKDKEKPSNIVVEDFVEKPNAGDDNNKEDYESGDGEDEERVLFKDYFKNEIHDFEVSNEEILSRSEAFDYLCYPMHANKKILYVQNIHLPNFNVNNFAKFFTNMGFTPKRIRQNIPSKYGNHNKKIAPMKGYAFVEFPNHEAALNVAKNIMLGFAVFNGHVLSCNWANSNVDLSDRR